MLRAGITAVGCYLPDQVLTNSDVISRFGLDIDEAWIESRTGIRSRHWLRDGETTSDMAVAAAHQVLTNGGLRADQLDRIVLATISGDYPSPATASVVAQKLGTRCPAYDISAACAGFLYGLEIAAGAIACGDKNVLVLCADARSRFIDKADRRSVVLFADGAGGALVQPRTGTGTGLASVYLGADGKRKGLGVWVPAGGAANPTSHATLARGEHFLQVEGFKEIFSSFIGYVQEAVERALRKAGMSLSNIDLFIPHQGNAHLVQQTIEALGFPAEKTINNVATHGNTSGASIPIALAEAVAAGRVKPGDTVLMAAVGAGNTFGAVVHQF
jgi:3-oxoacyl-[acyl-carrier-protein] synthase-3